MSQLSEWARALGGEVAGGQVLCLGPGHSTKDRSLAVKPTADGFVVHSHAGNDWQECRDYVRELLNFEPFTPGIHEERACVAGPPGLEMPVSPNLDRAREIWRASVDIRGTIAEAYLARRALTLDEKEDWHRVLRFHAACPFGLERAPAMIALMRDIVTDEPRSIQRTRLTSDGHKVDRLMLGPAKNAAIKIDPATKVTDTISIGEGFETCLSGRVQGFAPAWALGSAGAVAAFPVITGIKRLRIFAENDDEASERALRMCARRWRDALPEEPVGGAYVLTAVRPSIGKDLNDELRASFMGAVELHWPGAKLITETQLQERARFQKERVELRVENARIYKPGREKPPWPNLKPKELSKWFTKRTKKLPGTA
jgi:putative DNA primase/helicase